MGALLVERAKIGLALLWSRICDLSHFLQIDLFDFLLVLQTIQVLHQYNFSEMEASLVADH